MGRLNIFLRIAVAIFSSSFSIIGNSIIQIQFIKDVGRPVKSVIVFISTIQGDSCRGDQEECSYCDFLGR